MAEEMNTIADGLQAGRPAILDDPAPKASLNVEDFSSKGAPRTEADICTLVTQFRQHCDEYLGKEKWKVMWGDNNTLYNSPRPLTTYNGTYVLEPDVQRFTMAQDENTIVPQFTNGLFYQEPPFELRPGSNSTEEHAQAKKRVMSYYLHRMNFQRECEWALECMTHQGTTIVEWGITKKPVTTYKRESSVKSSPAGAGTTQKHYSDKQPIVVPHTVDEIEFTFERVPLTEVFFDPKLDVPDIRESKAVVRTKSVDFYDLQALRGTPGYNIPPDEELKLWFLPEVLPTATPSSIEQQTVKEALVNVRETSNVPDPHPLRAKKRMDIYWDKDNTYTVIGDRHCIRSMKNPYGRVPFLSANYWNCPNAMLGMGVGRLAGSDQRIETGSIGTALKVLAYKANAPYMRSADSNMPSQMQMTGLGRVITVANFKDGGYKIMETPDVPRDLFTVLADARQAREAATGADSMLQGGSAGSAGKMSTKATGAVEAIQGAGATKLSGPLGHFINQIFIPFIYILDELIYRYVSDQKIADILGKTEGDEFLEEFDMDDYHECSFDFDVLAGAKLAARVGQAQALVLLFQFLENPSIIQNLADIHGIQVDLRPLFRVAFNAYQFGAGIENDIFKPMDKQAKQQRAAANGANKLNDQLTVNNQKFQQKQALEDQANNNRITRDIVRDAFKKAGLGEIETGLPGGTFENET